jgi:hypothetical protein
MTEQGSLGTLGSIEQVDLKELWPNHEADFTPWLVEDISRLGDVLGMQLVVRGHDLPVKGNSLDILAQDAASNQMVVIETQFESTNHENLGKLLTYASGYDASVVVWVVKNFNEEHRQALDWLNQRTGDDTQFFGVVVELLKIDDSRPAVNFKLASFPNEWRKEAMGTSRTNGASSSDSNERYPKYVQELLDRLRKTRETSEA